MREHIRAFVRIAAAAFDLRGPVYEFGAYQVAEQGSLADLRCLFPGQEYIGCDLRPGPGVDRVEDLAALSLGSDTAQTILCVDTLEHVFEARRAVDEMIRVLAPGGVALVAGPMDFRIHNYPGDYWRLTPSCMERLFQPLDATLIGSQGVETFPHTVFGIGCKGPINPRFVQGVDPFLEEYRAWLRGARRRMAWSRRLKQLARGWFSSRGERRRYRDYHEARFVLHVPSRARLQTAAPTMAGGSRLQLG